MLIDNYADLKDFAFIPDRALDSYRRLTNASETAYAIRQKLNTEYITLASEEDSIRIVMKQDSSVVTDITRANLIYMTTSILANDGSPIVLVFMPNKRVDHQPWELQKAITETEFLSANYTELGNKPRDMLYNYAYWPNYIDDLKTLKNDLALPENWSYKENPTDDDFPILKSYIAYTFAKLWKDKQVYVSVNGQYSVFNTGLVNRNYQYIYVVFEKKCW